MKKVFLNCMLLLCALIVGSSNLWAAEETLAEFSASGYNGGTKNGWTVNSAEYASAGGGYYKLIASTHNIVSPSIDWSGYTDINITITARMFGGPSNAQKKISVKSGSTELTSYSPSGTSLVASSALTITPTSGALTIVCSGASSNKGSGVSSIVIKGTPKSVVPPAYEITAVSNNNEYGTVSLEGSTITATPASGYRVSTSTPYTVTAGAASVAQSGNNFTVTPTEECTVQINFELIPTYTVTIATPSNGTLSVKVGGASVVSGSKYPEGTILNITATPNDGYNIKNIQVVDASTHTYTASNTKDYTLTANNTEVRANFVEKVYHNVNWYVNGLISSTVLVEEGTAITKPAVNPANIGLKEFMGWVDSPIDGTTDSEPTFFSSANMGTEDVNYYAVFASAATGGDDTYVKITSSTFDVSETYVIGAEQAGDNHTMWYLLSYPEVDKNSTWGVGTSSPAENSPLRLTVTGTASSFIIQDEGGYYMVPWKTNFRMESTSSKATVSMNASGVLSGKSGADGTTDVNLRYNHNNGSGGFRWYDGSTGTQAYLYKIVPGVIYSEYCTSIVATISISSACTDGAFFYATYSNSSAFIVPADLAVSEISVDGGELLVEDYGTGEIVPANTGVMIASDEAGAHTIILTSEAGTSKLGSDNMLKPSGDAGITAANMDVADTKFYRLTMHNGNDIGFWWGADDGAAFDLAANKAYLAVPNSEISLAPMRFWIENEENNATNIDDIEANEKAVKFVENGRILIKKNGIVYDALGRIVK